jgi:hypothetical protein
MRRNTGVPMENQPSGQDLNGTCSGVNFQEGQINRLLQRSALLCLFLLILLAIPALSFAQSTRGELAGNVTDSTGAVVPGAKIVATGIETGVKSETVSTSVGVYHFVELAIGRYNVTVTAPGFASATRTGVPVTINSTTALNVTLKPGAATENVTVDASAPTIESESSDISGTITQQQIEELPLAVAEGVGGLRSPETFSFLVPGTTGPGTGGGQSSGGLNNNGVFYMKLSGGQSYGAEVLLDGASIQRSENGSSFDETSPSIEALQEFKVTLAVPSAEFGRSTAGLESFAIKNGTNNYHGTAFSIIKNAAFDANDWYKNGDWKYYGCTGNRLTTTTACEGYLRQQDSKFNYGGTLGGPIRIPNPFNRNKSLYNGTDKTFFFFAWEQYRLKLGQSTVATVPTTAETQGDFSANLGAATNQINPCTGLPVIQNQIFDPATSSAAITATNPSGIPCRMPFAGNKVPSSRFSNAAKALMAGLPAPNQTATLNAPYGFYNNYANDQVTPNENTTFTVRIDQALGTNNKIYGSYSSRDNDHWQGNAPDLPGRFNNSGWPQDFQTHYTRLGWDSTLSATMMNHVNIGYNRTNSKNFGQNFVSPVNLSTVGAPDFYSKAFPIVNWDGLDSYSAWGTGYNGDNIDNGLRFNDIVSWQKGRHSIKAGFDWRHQQYSVIDQNIPTINFLHSETTYGATSTPWAVSGNSLAGFELGEVDNSNQTVYNDSPRWNSHYWAGFIQDDIKVNASLTLNVGLRYDVDSPRTEALNRTSNFSLTAKDTAAGGLPGALVFATNCTGCNKAWADTWKKDIAPRLGFAYVLPHTHEKAVLRGGAAIIYAPLQYADFGGSMAQGFTQNRGVGSTYTGPGTAAGYTPAFQLDSGYSAWTPADFAPNTDPTQDQCLAANCFWAVGSGVITPKMGRPGQTTQWQLQVQDELAQDLILTVGYSALSAQNLKSNYISNVNNIDPKYFAMGDHLTNQNEWIPQGGSSSGVSAPWSGFAGPIGQALRPFPQYDYIADDCCLENMGHSSYESMVVSLNRKFRQGFNLQVSYTFSKNETDADSAIGNYAGRAQSQRSDLHGEKAVSVQNVPQQLSISYLAQLPFGQGRRYLNNNALLDRVVGGWEIGGIHRYQTGAPIQFGCATAAPYYQNCFRYTLGAAANGNIANVASSSFKKNKNGSNWFNQKSWFNPAFRPAGTTSASDQGVSLANAYLVDQNAEGNSAYGGGTWLRQWDSACYAGTCSFDPYYFSGESPLVPGGKAIPRVTGGITGPLWLSEDLSLIKNFKIYDNVRFQFKTEMINAFNRHHQAMPGTAPGAVTGLNSFGVPGGDDMTSRNIQFTGRINF